MKTCKYVLRKKVSRWDYGEHSVYTAHTDTRGPGGETVYNNSNNI